MLNDPYFNVAEYSAKSSDYFRGVDIKGGVAIIRWNNKKEIGPVGTFIAIPILRDICNKVVSSTDFEPLANIIHNQSKFDLEAMYKAYPEARQARHGSERDRRITANDPKRLPNVLCENKIQSKQVAILCLIDNKRLYRYIEISLLNLKDTDLYDYKVLVPKSNGSGAIGEVLSTPLIGTPLIGTPLIGYSQSFMGIGQFDNQQEAEACLKYVKTKFARAMLGTLKITQDNPSEKWRNVPLQDFTAASDIDWSKSIPEIDTQLYEKYGLTDEEISFIEEKVRAME